MSIFARPHYTSDATQFIESLKAAKPALEAEQRAGRTPNPDVLCNREIKFKAFLDYQNDVKVSDVQLAAREGYESVEHTKRYTTGGMATDAMTLVDVHGWSLQTLVSRYVVLGVCCLIVLALVYAWGVRRAKSEVEARRLAAKTSDWASRRKVG